MNRTDLLSYGLGGVPPYSAWEDVLGLPRVCFNSNNFGDGVRSTECHSSFHCTRDYRITYKLCGGPQCAQSYN